MAYMDKERAESARRQEEHLAKLAAYQQFEKERAKVQASIHAAHEAAMAEQRAKSARRQKEHLGKLAAYQQFEKERAKNQAELHATHEAGMDVVRERTATNRATHKAAMAEQRAKSATIHTGYLTRHREFERTYGNGKYEPRYG